MPDHLLPGLAWKGRYSALVADSKTGKSTLLAQALAGQALQREFLGAVPAPGRVAIMEEMGAAWMRTWISAHGVVTADVDFLDRASYADLLDYVRERQPVLLVVDTLSMLATANRADENAQKDMQLLNGTLLTVAREHGVAALAFHHTNRAGSYRGSSVTKADVDMLIEMVVTDHGDRQLRYTGRWPQGDVDLEFSKATLCYSVAGEDDDADRRMLRFIRENPGCTKHAVESGVMGRGQVIYTKMNNLIGAGRILVENGKLFDARER